MHHHCPLPLLQWKIWTYWQLQLKHYTCPIAQQTGCSSHSSLAAHSKLSFAYSAQRSQLNPPKCSLFGGTQMQQLFSKSFLRIWNTFLFHKDQSKDVVESQRFAQLWYQASGLRYRPIWTVTHESESAVIFPIHTEYQRQGLLDLMNMLFKRKSGLMNGKSKQVGPSVTLIK